MTTGMDAMALRITSDAALTQANEKGFDRFVGKCNDAPVAMDAQSNQVSTEIMDGQYTYSRESYTCCEQLLGHTGNVLIGMS
jgi:hypothetical protein